MQIYITFGQVHTHGVNGHTLDKDSVAVINCNSHKHGRELAFDFFGDKFCTSYTKDRVDKDFIQHFPSRFYKS